jgi:hypothetical protein
MGGRFGRLRGVETYTNVIAMSHLGNFFFFFATLIIGLKRPKRPPNHNRLETKNTTDNYGVIYGKWFYEIKSPTN